MAQGPDDKVDDDALRARLDKLSKGLGPAKRREDAATSGKGSDAGGGNASLGNGMGAGFRVVTELVAGVMVGGGLGWLLDRWLSTKPLLMIILGSLGLIGGFWNIVRIAMRPPGAGPGRFGG